MAWFECTTSASSGNGVALIVTTDASFAGSNITASNGEDTFTQQCPSTAPYVVKFEDIPTGTYTISGVTGGQTLTKTFVVSDYNFEFHDIPTGSTVTPVNVIQTWLHCANIWNKTYTTINQVLSDTSTLLALISSNNAADYMARSTNWASSVCANQTAMGYIGNNNYCANKLLANSTWLNAICNSTYFESVLKKKVPTMTSNTTPSGVVSASNQFDDNNDPWNVFSDNSKNWYTAIGSLTGWIQYQFTSTIRVLKLTLRNGEYTPIKKATLQGSNNGSSWTNIQTITNTDLNVGENRPTTSYTITNNNSYTYYRLNITEAEQIGLAAVGCRRIQMYGR